MRKKPSEDQLEAMTREELVALLLSSRAEMEEKDRKIAEAEKAIEAMEAKNYELQMRISELLAKIDAKNQTILRDNFNMILGKSEHIRERSPVNEAEAKSGGRRGRKPGSKAESLTPERLEAMVAPEDVFRIEPEMDPGQRAAAVAFGEDAAYKIVRTPASFRVIKVVRPKYRCGGKLLQAASADPFPHSALSPELAADIASAKFEMGIPLYRYQKFLASHRIRVTEQTLANWAMRTAEALSPVCEEMRKELVRGSSGAIHADETTLEVLDSPDPMRKKSYIFVYSSDYYSHPVDVYDFSQSRETAGSADLLEGFGGALVVDGYAGYNEVPLRKQRCWAHARRKFYDIAKTLPAAKRKESEACKVVAMMDSLFAEEREWREGCLTASEIKDRRNSPEYLAKAYGIRDFIKSLDPLEGSPLDKACRYFLKLGDELYTYLSDGRIPMTNNLAERTVKPFVIDRKNFLFCKTERGADAAAVLMTVIRTALRNALIPERYLCWVLKNITAKKPEELLPWSDGVPEDCRITL